MNECSTVLNAGDQGCHCQSCGGHSGCHCGHGGHGGCHIDKELDVAERMFHLAKCAKYSVLKQKMEMLLDAKIGEDLDKIAEIAVDAVIDHMRRMGAKKSAAHQYTEELMAALKPQ